MTAKRSNADYQTKAHRHIPGGAHTYSRGDDQYPTNAPAILRRGKGAYVWDAEGNKFLDYGMALRSVTIGYADRRVNRAAVAEIENGNNLTRASVTEVTAAEALCGLIPAAEMVKFAKNGSTVVSAAVKLARAYTGRTMVARCAQHPFFSYDDWFIGDTVMNSGVPDEISKLTVHFNFNDPGSLLVLFDRHPGLISCVVLEAATIEEPYVRGGRNFLQDVHALCKKHGAIFILDEMITGFRWNLRGAAATYNVIPDLVTFGKGMANGFSVAALAGKREIMRLGGLDHTEQRVFLMSTTHGAEMSGLGAFIETMKIYQERDVVGHLWAYGAKLISGINQIADDLKIGDYFRFEGVACNPGYVAKDRTGKASAEMRTLFSQEMIEQRILMPWVALCSEHGESELSRTLEAARRALKVYSKALETTPTRFLKGRPIKPVFRKFNNEG